MAYRWFHGLCFFLASVFALCVGEGNAFGRGENLQVNDEFKLQSVQVDKRRDGIFDYKVFMRVISDVTLAEVTVECEHSSVGSPSWFIRIYPTKTNENDRIDRRLVASAVLLAANKLRNDFSVDPIWDVCLKPKDMPSEFSIALNQAVAAHMRKLNSKLGRFDDKRVRKMVKDAYSQMRFTQYIKRRIEEAGFNVKVDTDELCCLRRSLENMRWKDIANLPDAGLEMTAATCFFILETRHESRNK